MSWTSSSTGCTRTRLWAARPAAARTATPACDRSTCSPSWARCGRAAAARTPGGPCGACGRWLPLHAFLLAPGGAALFATSQLVFEDLGPALLAGFFATIFLALAFTDLERRLLPNRVVYPSIV